MKMENVGGTTMRTQLVLIALVTAVMGCATVNNTVDRSKTVKNSLSKAGQITGIAITKTPQNAVADGLASDIDLALPSALATAFPNARIVDAEDFGQSLLRTKGYLAHFSAWRAAYEQTGVMDPRPVPHYAKAAGGVSHLLLIRSTSLDREKVTMGEALRAAPCRRATCWGNANNIWQTDLKVIAELIEARTGTVVWRGVGIATRIQEGSREWDFGLVRIDSTKGHSLETLAQKMVHIAADGIANQIR